MERVIYAAYGSNLLKRRFMAYINGGEYHGREYKGCTDTTPPIDLKYCYIPHKLYFAQSSSLWGEGGVAFLDPRKTENHKDRAIVRLWLILKEQFAEIQKQEGSWYTVEINLGSIDEVPVKTFTGEHFDEINPPSIDYATTIINGLMETTGWNEDRCNEYLSRFVQDE